jgi:hypothetical protein
VLAPAAVLAGLASELVVLGRYSGQLSWLVPLLIVVCVLTAGLLAASRVRAVRLGAVLGALAALLIAPGVWAFDTLGHSASGTFPEGGPASVSSFGSGPGGPGARRVLQLFGAGGRPGALPPGAVGPGAGAAGSPPQPGPGAGGAEPPLGGPPAGGGAGVGARGSGGAFGARGVGGPGGFGRTVSTRVISYVKAHGGGTIAVSSQSSAAAAIVSQDAQVAGIGGFSGRESSVGVRWLAGEVRTGKIRWVLEGEGAGGAGGVNSSRAR